MIVERIVIKPDIDIPREILSKVAVREETKQLIYSTKANSLSADEQKNLELETIDILQECGNPMTLSHKNSILVDGDIQVGKTTSFIALIALAKDNGYSLVIVFTGTATNLNEQTRDRLRKDFNYQNRKKHRDMLIIDAQEATKNQLEIALNLSSARMPNASRFVIIHAMKNIAHLKKLNELLSNTFKGHTYKPAALIIDDEVDQAGLNTESRSNESRQNDQFSAIHSEIQKIRDVFNNSSFIGYTATPQANLFTDLKDPMSPEIYLKISPGENYIGIKDYFNTYDSFIHQIPQKEIQSKENILSECPHSLMKAQMFFYLGVAIEYASSLTGLDNMSMIMHPSQFTKDHEKFRQYAILNSKKFLRNLEDSDSDTINDFREVYNDLADSIGSSIPSFDFLLSDQYLFKAITATQIVTVNSKNGSSVNWEDHFPWILIGGNALNRGFTVNDLTVTYMPRSLGVANVDTVSQRARFCGYKKKYINFCRVFLGKKAIKGYKDIVDHDKHRKDSISQYQDSTGTKEIAGLDKNFVLNEKLKLTRPNVLRDKPSQVKYEGWIKFDKFYDEKLKSDNKNALNKYIALNKEKFEINSRKGLPKFMRHRSSLKACLTDLLCLIKFLPRDGVDRYSPLITYLANLNDLEKIDCNIFFMGTEIIADWSPKVRAANKKGTGLDELFQGRNEISQGEREVKISDEISIQIHRVSQRDSDNKDSIFAAVWIPEKLSKAFVSRGVEVSGYE